MRNTVTILGCRGSVPVSGKAYTRYGGGTSCIFVRLGGQAVVLDAGTGMLALPSLLNEADRELPVLLSHAHVDHLLGLPMCPGALRPGIHFHIWGKTRNGQDVYSQVHRLLSPPLWPVGTDALPAGFSYHPIQGNFSLGPIQVDCMEGCHPGGVTLFRLTDGKHTIVYLPDCTLEGALFQQAAEFAQNCDLLLCDGQYSPAQWPTCRGFGHSTWEMAARLGQRCCAKHIRIIHHDPGHTDEFLDSAAAQLSGEYPNCTFAYEGEDILL